MPERDDDCLFCKILSGALPAEIVDEDDNTISFMDINPATPGHALVIPRSHADDLYELPAADMAATALAAQRLALRARDALGAAGVNLLNACRPAAWQTVFHYHVHVIPRYDDDPLRLPWIPRGGDAESIAANAALLRGSAA